MAKKAKKPSKAKSKTKAPAAKPRSKAAQIGVQDFKNLVRRCANSKKQASEISGEIGNLIKNAVENKNLDRTAFAMFRKLDAMSVERLATTLACLDYYIDIGELEKKIEKAPTLPIARQEAGEKEKGHASQKKGDEKTADKAGSENVVALRAAE